MNEKLLAELKQLQTHIREVGYGAVEDRQFTSIINRHKHEQDGLRDEIEREINRLSGQKSIDIGSLYVILSHHPTPKPQAEALEDLAKRKGIHMVKLVTIFMDKDANAKQPHEHFISEDSAKQYLEGLEDVK